MGCPIRCSFRLFVPRHMFLLVSLSRESPNLTHPLTHSREGEKPRRAESLVTHRYLSKSVPPNIAVVSTTPHNAFCCPKGEGYVPTFCASTSIR